MAPPMPTGIPMGAIPTGLPAVPAPMGAVVGQPMQTIVDGSVIQHHHQPPAQQQAAQPGLIQYTDQSQQQQYPQGYMQMPTAQAGEMGQGGQPMGLPAMQSTQWAAPPVQNNGSTQQTS